MLRFCGLTLVFLVHLSWSGYTYYCFIVFFFFLLLINICLSVLEQNNTNLTDNKFEISKWQIPKKHLVSSRRAHANGMWSLCNLLGRFNPFECSSNEDQLFLDTKRQPLNIVRGGFVRLYKTSLKSILSLSTISLETRIQRLRHIYFYLYFGAFLSHLQDFRGERSVNMGIIQLVREQRVWHFLLYLWSLFQTLCYLTFSFIYVRLHWDIIISSSSVSTHLSRF